MNGNQDQHQPESENTIDQAMDRSHRELKQLANFYHQHGYLDRAQEIYRTVLKIQHDSESDES